MNKSDEIENDEHLNDEQVPVEEGDVELNDQEEGEEIDDLSVTTLDVHAGHSVFVVATHPSLPHTAASGAEDERAYSYTLGTDMVLSQHLQGHHESVSTAVFSPNGKYLATGAMDGGIIVYKIPLSSPEEKWEPLSCGPLSGPDEVVWLSWHPSSQCLAAGGHDGTVWLWKIPSGDFIVCLAGHQDMVNAGQFTPSGTNILTVSADGSCIYWDPKTGSAIHKFQSSDARFGLEQGVTALGINSQSSVALVGGADGQLRLLNLVSGTIINALAGHGEDSSVEAIEFVPGVGVGGQGLWITAGSDGKIIAWEVQNGAQRWVGEHLDAISSLSLLHSKYLIATGSVDQTVKLWDARKGTCLSTLQGHTDVIHSVALTCDGQFVLSGGDDGMVKVFSTQPQSIEPST